MSWHNALLASRLEVVTAMIAGVGGSIPSGGTTRAGSASRCAETRWGEAIYHMPDGVFYHRALAYECFATEEDAQAAGYRRSER